MKYRFVLFNPTESVDLFYYSKFRNRQRTRSTFATLADVVTQQIQFTFSWGGGLFKTKRIERRKILANRVNISMETNNAGGIDGHARIIRYHDSYIVNEIE